jgi:hypothetical protein
MCLEMSQVLLPEVARQLVSNPEVRQRLQPLMPEGLGEDEESMIEVVTSPQFQQVNVVDCLSCSICYSLLLL